MAERRFRLAVVSASALHVLLILGVSLHHPTQRTPTSDLSIQSTIGVELALKSWSTQAASDAPSTPNRGITEPALSSGATTRHLSSGSSRSSVPVEVSQAPLSEADAEQEPSGATQQSTESGSALVPPGKSRLGLGPRRSGLGDDFGLAYALSQQEKAPSRTAIANDNLRRSMQQEQTDHDRPLGLNVPAPLILAIESAARDVAIPTNSVAVFTANIDGAGHLLGLEFNSSDHASPQWNKLSQQVEKVLHGRQLPIAKNIKGLDLKLRLVARVQLPSGHDRGTAVDVFGIPLKKGQGKRSSKISVLDPKPQLLELEVPGTDGQEKIKVPVPGLVLNVLQLGGDPSDIGAPARQIIRVQVLDEKVY